VYASYYLRLDSESIFYQRQAYDMFAFFGDLGGFAEILIIFGTLATAFFTEKMFFGDMIG